MKIELENNDAVFERCLIVKALGYRLVCLHLRDGSIINVDSANVVCIEGKMSGGDAPCDESAFAQ